MGRSLSLMVLAVCASVLHLPAGYGQEAPTPESGLRKFDPKQAIAFPGPVERVVQGEGAVWVVASKPRYPRLVPVPWFAGVTRVDPATRQAVAVIPIDGGVRGIAVGEGAVWVRQWAGDQPILKIDPATNKVSDSIAAGPNYGAMTAGGGALWVVDRNAKGSRLEGLLTGATHDRILRVDVKNARPVTTIPIEKGTISQIEFDGGAVWALAGNLPESRDANACIVRIDPQSNTTSAVIPVAHAHNFAVGEGAVWVLSSHEDITGEVNSRVTRIDPATNQAAATDCPGLSQGGLMTGQGAVWFVGRDRNENSKRYKIAAQTGRSTTDLRPFNGPTLSVGEYGVWGSVSDYHGDYSRDRKDPFVWPESYLTQMALPER